MNSLLLRPFILLALGALVAGCSSPQQLAQRNTDRCAARGLQPGTDAFNDCVVALETERDVRTRSRHREMMERSNVPAAATR